MNTQTLIKPAILLVEDDEILRITVYDALVKGLGSDRCGGRGQRPADLSRRMIMIL